MAERKQSVIMAPPATKGGGALSGFSERAAPYFAEKTLERLPDDKARQLYLKKRLKREQAFPNIKWGVRPRKYPDPAEGPHEPISVILSAKGGQQLDRYRTFQVATTGYVLARLFNNHEKGILSRLNDEE